MNRWPVSLELPVQWGDMDAFQHVNNDAYLRWFESARISYFEAAGVMDGMPSVGPILARQTIDYRLPLTYPDRLRASATVLRLGTTSFTMGLRLSSLKHGKVAAEGEAVIVMLDYRSGHKISLPESLRARLGKLEGARPAMP
jgi:acyl-CoA thioester hydrolase